MSRQRYFAAVKPSEVGESVWKRFEQTVTDFEAQRDILATAIDHYYGRDAGYGLTHAVTRGGEFGEQALVRIGRARALSKARQALITNTRVNWKSAARNSEAGAAKANAIAQRLVEDFWKNRRMNRNWLRWVELADAFARGYAFPEWSRDAGEPEGVSPTFNEDGTPKPEREWRVEMSGDMTVHILPPWRVHFDRSRGSHDELDWFFLRLYRNKYDLAAGCDCLPLDGRRGDVARDAILSTKPDERMRALHAQTGQDPDAVQLVYFLHRPTRTLPRGLLVKMLSADVVLEYGDLLDTYPEFPLLDITPDEVADTPHAWTQFWDSLGPQEVLDGIDSTLATIITTLGVPTVAYEKGSENNPALFGKGMRAWEYPKGSKPPSSVQLAQFPSDGLKYREALALDQRQLMGLNDVALGQPQGAQMNAQAFAMLASMAVQQASPFQQTALEGLAKLGTLVVKTLRKHVSAERILKVVGKDDQSLVEETKWSGKDLGPFEAVRCEIGEPLEQTSQGRIAKAQLYQSLGVPFTVEEIQQVVETGRIEPMERATRNELQLIKSECQDLQNGTVPPVHRWDNHALHYREHAGEMKTKTGRENLALLQACEQHNAMHYQEFFGVDPKADPMQAGRERFLMGFGPEPMPPAPPPGPGAAPPGPEAMPPTPEVPAVEMPQNPLTGQQFEQQTGGGLTQPQ